MPVWRSVLRIGWTAAPWGLRMIYRFLLLGGSVKDADACLSTSISSVWSWFLITSREIFEVSEISVSSLLLRRLTSAEKYFYIRKLVIVGCLPKIPLPAGFHTSQVPLGREVENQALPHLFLKSDRKKLTLVFSTPVVRFLGFCRQDSWKHKDLPTDSVRSNFPKTRPLPRDSRGSGQGDRPEHV